MKWHALTVLIYALLILVGGMMGFVKAHSSASLIAGTVAGLILIMTSTGIYYSHPWGLTVALAATSLLTLFFSYRYFVAQAFFPSGFTALISVVVLLLLSFLPRR